MTDQTQSLGPTLRDVARPALVWAVHFIFVYALLSAACAERGLLSFGWVSVAILIGTAAALIAAGWGLLRRGDGEFRTAARWTSVISILAILFNAAPLVLLDACR